jgi:hypothetical protein
MPGPAALSHGQKRPRAASLPRAAVDSATSRKTWGEIKAPLGSKLGEVVARIQRADFSTSGKKTGPGRPAKPPGFEIRTAPNGYSVYLSRSGKKLDYLCFLQPDDFLRVSNLPFERFGAWTLGRMRERERTALNAERIDALIKTVSALIEQTDGGSINATSGEMRAAQ